MMEILGYQISAQYGKYLPRNIPTFLTSAMQEIVAVYTDIGNFVQRDRTYSPADNLPKFGQPKVSLG